VKFSVCFLLFEAVKTRPRDAEIRIDAKGINIVSKAAFEIKGSLPAVLIKILGVLLFTHIKLFLFFN